MEIKKVKTLGVKEWFSNKNGLPNYEIDCVLEVREKAVKVTMYAGCGRTTIHWIPKSCLELRDTYNDNLIDLDGMTIDEAINASMAKVSVEEIVKMNKEEFEMYC